MIWKLIVTILVVCGAAAPARAQVPATAPPPAAVRDNRQVDVSAGYLNVSGSMHGWIVQLSAPITRRWSLVGELDGSDGPDPDSDEFTYTDVAGLGGVRFSWWPTARISPFWQVLAGGLRSRQKADYSNIVGRHVQHDETLNYFVFQPGAGVTVMVTPRFGVRTQGDFQFHTYEGGFGLLPQVAVGGVIRLGR